MPKLYLYASSVDRDQARGRLSAKVAEAIRILLSAHPYQGVSVVNGELA